MRIIASYCEGKVVEKELESIVFGRKVYRYKVSNKEDVERDIKEHLKRFPEKKRHINIEDIEYYVRLHTREAIVLEQREDINVGERVYVYTIEVPGDKNSQIKLLVKEDEIPLGIV
jgi:hypothetical protein